MQQTFSKIFYTNNSYTKIKDLNDQTQFVSTRDVVLPYESKDVDERICRRRSANLSQVTIFYIVKSFIRKKKGRRISASSHL